MLIAGPRFAPMMFNEPCIGFRVLGELYAVDDEIMPILDRLESVGKSGNLRVPIAVAPVKGGRACTAIAYMKGRYLADPVHSEYLHSYEDNRFIQFGRRY
jgi:gamma-glutamylaminecyclotransferase